MAKQGMRCKSCREPLEHDCEVHFCDECFEQVRGDDVTTKFDALVAMRTERMTEKRFGSLWDGEVQKRTYSGPRRMWYDEL